MEYQSIWRALIEYQKVLEISGYHAPALVADEQATIEKIKEKISLTFFYPPEKDYPSDWD
jgi:hypothetical protein